MNALTLCMKYFRYVNIVSGLCLHLRDAALELNLSFVAATIAQGSAAGSQGGPSNLQRFRAHHPPTFTGGGGGEI